MKLNRHRKAISPVLATVILIAITLIAAIAIAGFVFGLFGSFTSSAQVSAHVSKCTAGTGTTANNNQCTVVLTNTGTSNVAVVGGSEQIGGVAVSCNAAPTGTIPASGSLQVTCLQAVATAAQTVGSQAIGSFSLSNGASVPFSGVWS
jgi:flagellin-like protein